MKKTAIKKLTYLRIDCLSASVSQYSSKAGYMERRCLILHVRRLGFEDASLITSFRAITSSLLVIFLVVLEVIEVIEK